MNDSDWRDPFTDDDAARERAARRAERERRRRERSAQESLGERVREELSQPKAPPPAAPPPAEEPPSSEQPSRAESDAPPPAPPPPRSWAPPEPDPPETRAVPPVRDRSDGGLKRRRFGALAGVAALVVLVVAGASFVSGRGGEGEALPPPKERKTVEVVIPEGYDRTQIAPVAKKAGLKGNYLEATEDSSAINLSKYGAGSAESLEGFLFPATYEVFRRSNVKSLVKKQLEAFEANAAEAGLEAAAKKRGMTVYELVIVASMVEREIAIPEERELAASVIYNRLEQGTPLGIDSTIRFEDGNYTEPLVQSRLESDTPYNTRLNPGLPPGPIGNPGLASLEAAADPANTDFFYFVIKPGTCNEHAFVETQAEFDQAEAEYQAALQAQGGSPTDC